MSEIMHPTEATFMPYDEFRAGDRVMFTCQQDDACEFTFLIEGYTEDYDIRGTLLDETGAAGLSYIFPREQAIQRGQSPQLRAASGQSVAALQLGEVTGVLLSRQDPNAPFSIDLLAPGA